MIFSLLGVSIEAMRGSNTAVFIGCGLSEALEAYVSDPDHVNAYAPIGCSSAMLANRISYAFDLKGSNLKNWSIAFNSTSEKKPGSIFNCMFLTRFLIMIIIIITWQNSLKKYL